MKNPSVYPKPTITTNGQTVNNVTFTAPITSRKISAMAVEITSCIVAATKLDTSEVCIVESIEKWFNWLENELLNCK